ncbi:MAG TPA: hypothetical protein VIG64_06360 [Actinomycetota bacterium]|jgi:hypothetical protein
MKKSIVVLLVLGLIMGALVGGAEAKKKKKKKPPVPTKITRVVEFEYTCPCVGQYQFGSATGTNLGGGPIATGAEDLYITGEAVDASGQPVAVDINQDTDGDGFNDAVGSFCGKSEAPIAITPGLEIRVFVGNPEICPGAAAGGTIKFELSNMP